MHAPRMKDRGQPLDADQAIPSLEPLTDLWLENADVEVLLDPDSFEEYDMFVEHRCANFE